MERGATGRLGFWSGGKQAIVELAGRRRERPWLNSVDVRGVRVMSSPREHGAVALVGLAQPFARPRHRGALLSGALCVSCVRAASPSPAMHAAMHVSPFAAGVLWQAVPSERKYCTCTAAWLLHVREVSEPPPPPLAPAPEAQMSRHSFRHLPRFRPEQCRRHRRDICPRHLPGNLGMRIVSLRTRNF